MKKTIFISSRVVKKYLKLCLYLGLLISYFVYKDFNYIYDIIFLVIFIYLIIKYYTVDD